MTDSNPTLEDFFEVSEEYSQDDRKTIPEQQRKQMNAKLAELTE